MKIQNENIINDNDPLIREKSKPVKIPLSKENKALAKALLAHVQRSQDSEIAEAEGLRPAVGIAAVQVGVLKQILAISIPYEDDESESFVLANPKIISHSTQKSYLASGEGCLSVAEVHEGIVPRSARIKVRAYDCLNEEEVEFRLEGYEAIVLQHEIDHFSGILFYDRINPEAPWAAIPDADVVE